VYEVMLNKANENWDEFTTGKGKRKQQLNEHKIKKNPPLNTLKVKETLKTTPTIEVTKKLFVPLGRKLVEKKKSSLQNVGNAPPLKVKEIKKFELELSGINDAVVQK